MILKSSLPYLGNKWPPQNAQNSIVIYLFDICFPICFLQPWDKSVSTGGLCSSQWRGMNQLPAAFTTCCLKSSQINASFIWYGLKLYITHSENGQKRRSQTKIPSGDLDEMMLTKHLQSLVCFNAEAWPNSNRNLCLSSLTSIYLTHNDRCFYTRDSCIFKGFIINTFIRFGTFFNRKATLELFRVFFPYCL